MVSKLVSVANNFWNEKMEFTNSRPIVDAQTFCPRTLTYAPPPRPPAGVDPVLSNSLWGAGGERAAPLEAQETSPSSSTEQPRKFAIKCGEGFKTTHHVPCIH